MSVKALAKGYGRQGSQGVDLLALPVAWVVQAEQPVAGSQHPTDTFRAPVEWSLAS